MVQWLTLCRGAWVRSLVRELDSIRETMWGCRIVWCILTSRYLVSLLPVSIIHVSDIFLVGFWSCEKSFIMWGCRGWGWQAAGLGFPFTWNSGIPHPHRVTWSQPINMHPVKARGRAEKPVGELKSPRAPKFEQKPAPFVPIELL